MDNKSVFIIMMGPSGSGKGHIATKCIEYLNDKLNINITKVERSIIDDILESDSGFRDETSEYVRREWTESNINDVENNIESIAKEIIQGNLSDIAKKLQDTSKVLSDTYFRIRNEKKYNLRNDSLLLGYIENHKNIIFETTGGASLNWLHTNFLKETSGNYIVVLVYPYVNRFDVIVQAIRRFTKQARIVLTGTDNTWVRLPDLSKLYDTINDIQKNFVSILNECQTDKTLMNYILLYDNRPRYPDEPKIVLVDNCDYKDIMDCTYINEFINTIEQEKILYDKLKDVKCMHGGMHYHQHYVICRDKYLALKQSSPI